MHKIQEITDEEQLNQQDREHLMQQKANAGKPIPKLMLNIDKNEAERQELQAEKSRILNWAAWFCGE